MTVTKGTPEIGAFADVIKTYGDADFSLVQPSSTSDGAWSYSPSVARVTLNDDLVSINYAGTVVITATQAETDNYSAATTSMTLTILKAVQSIAVDAIPTTQPLKDFDTIAVGATANSGADVAIALADGSAATLSGTIGNYSLVNIGSTGVVEIIYTAPETNRYLAATVSQVMDVVKVGQNITFDVATPIAYTEDLTIDLTASVDSGLTPELTLVSGPATLSGSTLTVSQTGIIVVKASQSGNAAYNPAIDVQKSILIEPGSIELSNFEDMRSEYLDYLKAAQVINPPTTTTSAGITQFVYSSENPMVATISGSTYQVVAAGTTTITAKQLAVANKFNSATITAQLIVDKSKPTLSITDITKTFNDVDFDLSASSNSPGTISYSSAVSSVATIDGSTVSIKGGGSTIITATQLESANFTSATATATLTVEKDIPVIVFGSISKTYNDDDFELSATSNSSGAFSYSSSDTSVATISGSLVHIVGAGSSVITLSQETDSNYKRATATASLFVDKDVPTISDFVTITKTYLDSNFSLNPSSTSSAAISYSATDTSVVTISGNLVHIEGAGTTSITLSQVSDDNYYAHQVSIEIVVNKATPEYYAVDQTKQFSDGSFVVDSSVLYSNSDGAFVFNSSNTDAATVSGSTIVIAGGGTTVINATQAESDNFLSGTSSFTLYIGKVAPTLRLEDVVKTYGDAEFNLSVTTNSTGAIQYSSSDSSVATIEGSTVHIVGAGSSEITVNQDSDASFLAASTTMKLTVNKKSLTVSQVHI